MPAAELEATRTSPQNKFNHPLRNGETGLLLQRSRRYYYNNRQWFFRSRERLCYGSFNTFRDAEQQLKLHLRRCGVMHYKPESPALY